MYFLPEMLKRSGCGKEKLIILVSLATFKYGLPFYMQYLAHWPEYFQVAEAPSGDLMGYIMGKSEGDQKNWHGHVTALTVAPEFRRLHLSTRLMQHLEEVSERKNAWFVDLFVRQSNTIAIDMYRKLGYEKYRTVLGYYTGDHDEDAYDMRKSQSRDAKREYMKPLDHDVRPEDLESG